MQNLFDILLLFCIPTLLSENTLLFVCSVHDSLFNSASESLLSLFKVYLHLEEFAGHILIITAQVERLTTGLLG